MEAGVSAGRGPMPDVSHVTRRRRSHHGHGSIQQGRVWVILIFFMLRCGEAVVLLDMADRFGVDAVVGDTRTLGANLSSLILSTGLLAGIWCRQNWARYASIVLLILGAFAALVVFGEMLQINIPTSQWRVMSLVVLAGGINAACAWVLISSRDIKRLTNKIYDD